MLSSSSLAISSYSAGKGINLQVVANVNAAIDKNQEDTAQNKF